MKRGLAVAAGASVVLLAGCGSVAASHPVAARASRPVLSPVCSVYNYRQPNLNALDSAEADNYNGPGQGKLLHADSKPPVYIVMLRNWGAVPVAVDGITTALSDSSSQELTSDTEGIGQTIAPDQSLQFTFAIPSSYVSSQTDDWGNPADYSTNVTSCELLTWN
jgi:hypothetical protein